MLLSSDLLLLLPTISSNCPPLLLSAALTMCPCGNVLGFVFQVPEISVILYSLRPTLFVLFEKSKFLREHHLLFCLPSPQNCPPILLLTAALTMCPCGNVLGSVFQVPEISVILYVEFQKNYDIGQNQNDVVIKFKVRKIYAI